jgi:hypothetical protein
MERIFRPVLAFSVLLASISGAGTDAFASVPRPYLPNKLPDTDVYRDLLLRIQVGPAPSPSQTAPDTSPGPSGGTVSGGPDPAIGLNWSVTRTIERNMESIVRECGDYDPVYRIDCLKQGIDLMIRRIPPGGGYSRIISILNRASARLGSVVDTYADADAPRLVPEKRANPNFLKRRSYRAVKRQQLKQALARAVAIIREAETQLLRSSENSARRLSHYQTIATSVGSSKAILRSS